MKRGTHNLQHMRGKIIAARSRRLQPAPRTGWERLSRMDLLPPVAQAEACGYGSLRLGVCLLKLST
jgi:hypothetical protein